MPAQEAAATNRKLHSLEMDIAHASVAQPDADTVLGTLQNHGFALGILTRNAEDIAHATLAAAGLDQYFTEETIIGRCRFAAKPDPAGIDYLLQLWNADKRSSVIVGDYLFDLQTGRNAGIATVHFDCDGNYPWPDLTDIGIDRLSALLDYL